MLLKKIFQNENLWLAFLGGTVIVLVSIVRLRLLGVPLERDEGEYAYIAQQLLQGSLPYVDSYSMKLPGIYLVYAFILTIFGQTPSAIHLALFFTNIATAILLFFISRFLFNKTVGVVAGTFFLVLTLGPTAQGHWANAEHFVVLFALSGLLLALNGFENDSNLKVFISGLLLGFTFLIKQHGIFFLLFGFFYSCLYLFKNRSSNLSGSLEKVGLFTIGGSAPLILTIAFYYGANGIDALWFWTVDYASKYTSLISWSMGFHKFEANLTKILIPNYLIILFSFIGLVWAVLDKSQRSKYIFPVGLFIISFLAITPGLYFRKHYYILWIPALALLAGIGVSGLINFATRQWIKTIITIFVVAVSISTSFYTQKLFFFDLSTKDAARYTYATNPFHESLAVADFIRKNSSEDDKVAILGSEPH
jgi:4-amino-4-deoxy-L-arabinose transferase-like glycosyltransferase